MNVSNSRTKAGIPPRPISQSNPTLTAPPPVREAFVKNKEEWVFSERAVVKAQARAAREDWGQLLWVHSFALWLGAALLL